MHWSIGHASTFLATSEGSSRSKSERLDQSNSPYRVPQCEHAALPFTVA